MTEQLDRIMLGGWLALIAVSAILGIGGLCHLVYYHPHIVGGLILGLTGCWLLGYVFENKF